MLSEEILNNNLCLCNEIYISNTPDKKQLILKLALLEVCAWIEECLDNLYSCVTIDDEDLLKKTQDKIKKVYDFKYDTVQNMLVHLIGVYNFSKFKNSADISILENMQSSLGTLKKYRDSYAHTTYSEVGQFLGFSEIENNLSNIKQGIIYIEKYLENNNFAGRIT